MASVSAAGTLGAAVVAADTLGAAVVVTVGKGASDESWIDVPLDNDDDDGGGDLCVSGITSNETQELHN